MKAIGKNILVEQIFTKKKGSVIIVDIDNKKPSADKYDNKIKLVQLGKGCSTEEISVGDILFLNNYATPLKVEIKSKTEKKVVNLAIYNFEDVVGKE
tara:strand:- start:398 stop:688 length:291 start_codon:yes stop_codon:yes gene_type:complete